MLTVKLSFIIQSVILQCLILLSNVWLSVIIHSAILQIVVAPKGRGCCRTNELK